MRSIGIFGMVAAFVLAFGFTLLSVYGWIFHFSVGPAHGAGAEVGLLAGVAAMVFIVISVLIIRQERKANGASASHDAAETRRRRCRG